MSMVKLNEGKNESTAAGLAQFIQAARRSGAPLLAISTPDQPADEVAVLAAVAREALKSEGEAPGCGVIRWTTFTGLVALNPMGQEVIDTAIPPGLEPSAIVRLPDALSTARKFPAGTVLICRNAHLFIEEKVARDALLVLREEWKADGKTLCLLGPSFNLPPEISQDFLTFDVALPDRTKLQALVTETYDAAREAWPKLAKASPGLVDRAAAAVQGLSLFGAEQALATSLNPSGVEWDTLAKKKRDQVSQTRGLSLWAGKDDYKRVGGYGSVKRYLTDVFNGPERPECIVFLDEIDKAMAGSSGGDTSGVSQDMLGAVLSWADGTSGKTVPMLLALGPPGAGKSAVAKATAGEMQVPCLVFDFGAMKDSLVGQSGANLRSALKVVDAVSNGRPLVIATCNGIDTLKPELRRRFISEWFFDLPTASERPVIWEIWLAAFKLDGDQKRPADDNWTGAEIKKCCETAWRLRRSLVDAGKMIVPVAVSAADQIERLRREAVGKFLDASRDGVYTRSAETTAAKPAGKRTFKAGEN